MIESDVQKHEEWPWGDELDAITAACDFHAIITENEVLRIVEVVIPPGKKEPMHTHSQKSFVLIISSPKIRYHTSTGEILEFQRREIDKRSSFPDWVEPEGPHAIENIDTIEYHALRAEKKEQ